MCIRDSTITVCTGFSPSRFREPPLNKEKLPPIEFSTQKVQKEPQKCPSKFARCECRQVLLVDDEPLNSRVLEHYLHSINVQCDKAENGMIALTKIRQKMDTSKCCRGYNLIFMDINMPLMDGVETTREIQKMIQKKEIPQCIVIAVTAAIDLDQPEVYQRYLNFGFSHILSKPVKKDIFLKTFFSYS
eukprot:TRINITY_DN15117_c0_g1_i1.p1 TRINITY_DN15117_c0_g1~~TRINITY_DN15117_c0_g1_i1.p1  ORF type:complete len:188 (+),score=25.47 TRINITY_DN15117_c0_g1_i1:136-699(+)